MLIRFLGLVAIVPLVELALLVWLSDKISLGATLALIVCTGVAGAWLLRRQTGETVRRIQADMAAGRVPADAMLDGLLVLIAAGLLIIPGVLTDLVALVLLFPPTRTLCKVYLARRLAARMVLVTPADGRGTGFAGDNVIDARVIHTNLPSESG